MDSIEESSFMTGHSHSSEGSIELRSVTNKTFSSQYDSPPLPPEDSALEPFSTRLTPELKRQLKSVCAERGIRMQDAVYIAPWRWLRIPAE